MRRALLVAALGAPLLAWSWMRLESGHDAGQATLVVAARDRRRARPAARARGSPPASLALLVDRRDRLRRSGTSGRCPAGCSRASAAASSSSTTTRCRSTRRRTRGCTACCWSRCSPSRSPSRWRSPPAGRASPRSRWSSASAGRGRCCRATTCCAGRCCWSRCSRTAVVLRHGPVRGLGAALAAGTLVLVAALAATSSPAFAKRAFLDWQHWDPYTKPAKPVDVSYVWNSSYSGPHLPRQADDRHAREGRPAGALLARLGAEHRRERDLVRGGLAGVRRPAGAARPGPGSSRRASCARSGWEEQHVTIEALRDHRLPGGSVPVRFEPGDGVGSVSYDPTGVAIADARRSRAATATTSGATRRPRRRRSSPRRSRSTRARSSRRTTSTARCEPRVYPRLFGRPGRAAYVHYLMTRFARADQLRPFARLQALAEQRRRRGAQPVRGGGRARAVVPLRRRVRLRPASAEDARRRRAAGRLRRAHEARLLPALRRRDGADAALPRDPVARRGRVRERELPARRVGRLRPRRAHVGRGLVPRLGLDAVRPDAGSRRARRARTRPRRRASTSAPRRPCSPGKEGFRQFGNTLANTLGFGTKARTSPDVPQLGGAAAGRGPTSHHRRDWGILRAAGPGDRGRASCCSCWRSCCVRGSRFLTRDPRRLAGACRAELRDFLLDQGVDVPASATLRELAALVESEFRVEAGAFGLHATAARFAPRRRRPRGGARDAARPAGGAARDAAALSRSERVRGLLSLRSLGLA